MVPDLSIVRDIAEEEAADAYEALSDEILELREEIEGLRREVAALKRGVLGELECLKDLLVIDDR